jgi:hypothetical protein
MKLRKMATHGDLPRQVLLSDVEEFLAATREWPDDVWVHCVILYRGLLTAGEMTGLSATLDGTPRLTKMRDDFAMTLADVRGFAAMASGWDADTPVSCWIPMDGSNKSADLLGLEATDEWDEGTRIRELLRLHRQARG